MTGAAFAADVAMAPVSGPLVRQRAFEWTGLYFGVNAGWAWGREDSSVHFTGAHPGGSSTPFGLGATELSGTAVLGAGNLSGAIAGGQIGFNWQSGALVLGGEIDGQWSGQQSSFAAACIRTACTAEEAPRIRAIGTARARLGYAFDNVMAYVTGGGAIVSVLDNLTMTVAGVNGNFLPHSSTTLGWAAGAGVELGLWRNWSAKLEYLYIGYINAAAVTAIPGVLGAGTAVETSTYHDNILRVGLNYRFGPNRGTALLESPAAFASVAAPKVEIEDYVRSAPRQRAISQVPSRPPAAQVAQQGAQQMAQGDADEAAAEPVVAPPSVAAPSTAGSIEMPKVASIDTVDGSPRKPKAAKHDPENDESRRIKRVMSICSGC